VMVLVMVMVMVMVMAVMIISATAQNPESYKEGEFHTDVFALLHLQLRTAPCKGRGCIRMEVCVYVCVCVCVCISSCVCEREVFSLWWGRLIALVSVM
jgi:hypothetical protein